MKRIYIIRKFVQAKSVEDALKKEKKYKPEEIYLDETSYKQIIEDTYNEKQR